MRLNYSFGTFEVITNNELLPLSLDEETGIKLDSEYSFAMANVSLSTDSAGLILVPSSSYVLGIDSDYTSRESDDGGTDAIIYKTITITDNTYAGITLYLSGNNYGSYTDNELMEAKFKEILSGTAQAGIGSIHKFATSRDRTAEGLHIFNYNNPISQSVYAAGFAEIGHSFNDAHVAVGDPDLVALDNGTFYPTPPPETYGRSGIPNVNFTEAEVSSNLLSFATPTGFRDGTIFRYEVLTGTTIVNLVDGTEYYLRRVDASTVSLHATEAGAIANTSPIAISGGSGTFRLTQEGIRLNDAFQGHAHQEYRGSASAGFRGGYGSQSTTSYDREAGYENVPVNANLGDGDPRTTNETRPETYYEFSYIKVESVLSSTGEVASSSRYDTGWIANSDWTNFIDTISHNLNCNLAELQVKILFSTDGTDVNSFEQILVERAVANLGIRIDQIDLNSFQIETGSAGIPLLLSGGSTSVIDTESWFYRIVATKPNLVATVSLAPQVVNITDAVDVTKTLPDASTYQGEYIIKRRGAGTGKVLIATQDSQTIDGLVASTWDLEGEGILVVFPSGGNWEVKEYTDSGSNVNGNWVKNKDGSMDAIFLSTTTSTTSIGVTNVFVTPPLGVSFPIPFVSAPFVAPTVEVVGAIYAWGGSAGDISTTGCNLRGFGNNASQVCTIGYRANGRWRA